MSGDDLILLAPEDTFHFRCHPQLACFNQCCRDLNQALTPYDVLRLRRGLGITSGEFLRNYAAEHVGPTTGLPIVSLRFDAGRQWACPFVSASGCRVYADRPSSCRLYPLARGVQYSREDRTLRVQYALIEEEHCLGFGEPQMQTVAQWIVSQDLALYHELNDAMMSLLSLKNRLRPGSLPVDLKPLARMALYDLDTLKGEALKGRLPGLDYPKLPPPPPGDATDEMWLRWALVWLQRLLFGDIGIERDQIQGARPCP